MKKKKLLPLLQVSEHKKDIELTPEKELWHAVLLRAIWDVVELEDDCSSAEKEQSRRWLFFSRGAFSASWCCQVLGIAGTKQLREIVAEIKRSKKKKNELRSIQRRVYSEKGLTK